MSVQTELEKIESCADSVSKVLQRYYPDVEPFVADQLSLVFLSNNFHTVGDRKISRTSRVMHSVSSFFKDIRQWHKYAYGMHTLETALAVIVGLGIVIFGFVYLISHNMPELPYHGVVAESYRFCGKYSCERVVSGSHIVLPQNSEAAFDSQIENLKEGESVDMAGSSGHTITLTKKNKQVLFLEKE